MISSAERFEGSDVARVPRQPYRSNSDGRMKPLVIDSVTACHLMAVNFTSNITQYVLFRPRDPPRTITRPMYVDRR